MKMLFKYTLHPIRLVSIFTLYLSIMSNNSAFAQKDAPVNLSAGVNVTLAPTLKYDDKSGSGIILGAFGDLEVARAIGRVQFSVLLPSTLSTEDSKQVESGFSVNGSVGYSHAVSNSKLEIPFMATAGFAKLVYSRARNTFSDRCMQIGLTVSPQYRLNDRLFINCTGRYLKGIEVAGGGVIDQIDLSIGIRYSLL